MKDSIDYEWIFGLIDGKVKQERLFLKQDFTLPELADAVGTNRTYASRAICTGYSGFRDYINTLRIEYFLDEMYKSIREYFLIPDKDDFAGKYGFRNLRSFNRILKIHTGYSLPGLVKKYFDNE